MPPSRQQQVTSAEVAEAAETGSTTETGSETGSVVAAAAAAAAAVAAATAERQRLCTNCRNHGLNKVWKKHKRYCKFRDCPCAKCMKTAATRRNCAEQTARRRARQEDELREQELQRNPDNFQNERPVPYPVPGHLSHTDSGALSAFGSSAGRVSRSSLAEASSTTVQSSSRTSDYDDSQSVIDIGDSGGEAMSVEKAAGGGGDDDMETDPGRRNSVGATTRGRFADIDADPRETNDQIDRVKHKLQELYNRTRDIESLDDAFRLFILQHYTYDVDRATKLIKRDRPGELNHSPKAAILY